MDIEAIYRAIVEGAGDGGDLSWTRRSLQHLALERAKTGAADARLGSLRVSALLGPIDGLPIANELLRDGDARIRTLAFNQVVAARENGLPGLRTTAEGADPDLAIAAWDLLLQWVDAPAGAVARRCLLSPDPRIRRRAVQLLGQVAGAGAVPEIGRLVESEPAPEVREAANEALRRIAGELPKAVRVPWWSDETQTLPVHVPAEAEPPRSEPHRPETLGGDTRGLLQRLGAAEPEGRAAIVETLKACPPNERAAAWTSAGPGGDPALARGLARAAAAFGEAGALSKLLGFLGDPDPGVRIAGAEAVGALGAAGSIPRLAALFHDPDPSVAAAAVRAMAALSVRVGRADVGRGQLSRIAGSVPDLVATAVAEARELLGVG